MARSLAARFDHGLPRDLRSLAMTKWTCNMLTEINFDGIVGPSHNYAGLSLGNIASAGHAGNPSYPRAAALQGAAKMRGNLARLGVQGFLLPLPRPNHALTAALALDGTEPPQLRAAPWSASSMWTANAATFSPAADTGDGRTHLSAANLSRLTHRSIEHPETSTQLRLAFAHPAFAVHDGVPATFGDEGAPEPAGAPSGLHRPANPRSAGFDPGRGSDQNEA